MIIDAHQADHFGTTAVAAAEAGARLERLPQAPWRALLALEEARELPR